MHQLVNKDFDNMKMNGTTVKILNVISLRSIFVLLSCGL